MDFKYAWRLFAANSAIHGLHDFGVERSQKNCNRWFWLFLIAVSFTVCTWQGYLQVQKYLAFNVKTMTTYEFDPNLQYPAITIWPKSSFRRTVIGRHQLRMVVAAVMGGSARFKQLFYQINKTCYYEPNVPDLTDKVIDKLDFQALSSATPDVIMNVMEFASLNRKMIFGKCYQNEEEISCEKLVLVTLMDNQEAFSINLNSELAKYFLGNESGLGPLNRDYIPTDKSKQLFAKSNENGFKFILNANADEYCSYWSEIWLGFGFHIKFHDPRVLPSQLYGTSIMLKPGYEFNIAMKPIRHIRNTEHLGKCLSSFPLYMFPESVNYLKEFCNMQCENELAWKKCGCLSTFLLPAGKSFAQKHHIDISNISLGCAGGNRSCLFELMDLAIKYGSKMCPQCKEPCQEIEYSYEMTMTQFPPKHLVSYYKSELNVMKETSLRTNYLSLNVYFESSTMEIVVESQMFTLREMFIYIGSTISLFLGMSFMSFGEIVQLLLEIAQVLAMKGKGYGSKMILHRTRVKRINIQLKKQRRQFEEKSVKH